MAKSTGLNQRFYVAGYNLSGDVGALNNVASPRGVLSGVQGINASGTDRFLLRGDGVIDYQTWFNDAAGQEHAAQSGLVTTEQHPLWALGTAIGDTACFMRSRQNNYDWSRNADGSMTGQVTHQAMGAPLLWGELLTATDTTHGSATTGSAKDDAAQTTAGFEAVISMTAKSSGTPTFAINDSADDGSYGALLSFGAMSGIGTVYVRYTGTVERYLKIVSTGTFSNAVFTVAYRRGLAVDDDDKS